VQIHLPSRKNNIDSVILQFFNAFAKMLLCSVIIPCYNEGSELLEAIESIKKQTYNDKEIIVVNDGSTNPETLSLLTKLGPDIIVKHKSNGGLASARNYGIRHANGDIIVTLDSDDKFEKSFISKAVKILDRQPDIGIVSSYVQEFGISKNVWRSTAYDDFSFLTENRIVACCAFRKKCWDEAGEYDEQMRSGLEDWEFWIRVTKIGWKVHVIPERLFYYRKKASSMLVDETRPKMESIVSYVMNKHKDWFLSSLKKGIVEKKLLNKQNLKVRRIIGLLVEKLIGKF
jgi:glycosyltransferase involved in cell wall biosynthesis